MLCVIASSPSLSELTGRGEQCTGDTSVLFSLLDMAPRGRVDYTVCCSVVNTYSCDSALAMLLKQDMLVHASFPFIFKGQQHKLKSRMGPKYRLLNLLILNNFLEKDCPSNCCAALKVPLQKTMAPIFLPLVSPILRTVPYCQ